MGLAKRIGLSIDMAEKVPLTPEILVPRLGHVLVEKGLITEQQLQFSLDRQTELKKQGTPSPFGMILVENGFLNQSDLDQAVTEQIMALRSALQEANQNLEKRVEQRTAELQEALQKLSELSLLKSNFVSNISHELRTPLTHIKGYLDLILSQDLGPINPDQQRAMQVMQRSSERLERLIEDLIMFSTAERGEISIHVTSFNLVSLCRAVVQRAKSKAAEKQIDVQLINVEDDIHIDADEDKIGWVLIALLDNAIKFTPAGKSVGFKLIIEGKFVRVNVFDCGIGIPKDKINEIFEPFHQLDGSSTRRYGGTGLGLALVRRIVDGHGSVIKVTSQVNLGSHFEFLLKRSSC
jgi:two-component system sensor histidine kinase/response regulator